MVDMLHVTSIAPGDVHLAVVNGKRMAEHDSFDLNMPAGVVTLRVIRIEDGLVQFEHEGQTIEAKIAFGAYAEEISVITSPDSELDFLRREFVRLSQLSDCCAQF